MVGVSMIIVVSMVRVSMFSIVFVYRQSYRGYCCNMMRVSMVIVVMVRVIAYIFKERLVQVRCEHDLFECNQANMLTEEFNLFTVSRSD